MKVAQRKEREGAIQFADRYAPQKQQVNQNLLSPNITIDCQQGKVSTCGGFEVSPASLIVDAQPKAIYLEVNTDSQPLNFALDIQQANALFHALETAINKHQTLKTKLEAQLATLRGQYEH